MIKVSVTIRDIARIAGVSHSTVSRSLNDSPLISEKTKKRIKKIAKELNFEFNANAQSLNTKKTGTIGIIYPEQMDEFRVSLYHSFLLNDIRYSLETESLDSIVAFPQNRFTKESNIQKLISRKKIDGLMIAYSDINHDDWNYIKQSGIPHVFLHYTPKLEIMDEVDLIATDHLEGGLLATNHLIQLGHRKIMCLSADMDEEEFLQRTNGYKIALEQNSLEMDEKFIFTGDFSFQSGYKLIKENAAMVRKITAIFAQSDLMALGAIKALAELNLKVPQDIAVVGYDDVEVGTYFAPTLTTIHQPRETIARVACERLIQLLNDEETNSYSKTMIKPRLVIRQSCGSKS